MTWNPISGTIPQYQTSTGALASNYYLKFYQSGTTTAFSMATDSTGGTTLAKCQLDSSGYPTTDGSTRFIPHVNQKYKIVLYKNSTDADANTTGNADWVLDAIEQVQVGSTDAWVSFSGTPTQTSATTFTLTGDQTSTFTVGTRCKFTDSSTLYGIVTASAYTSLTTVTVTLDSGSLSGSLSAVYRGLSTTVGQEISAETIIFNARQTGSVNVNLKDRLSNVVSVKDYGAVGDGVTDDTAAIQAAIDVVEAVGGGIVKFPMTSGGGDYRVSVTKGTNDKYGIKIDASNVSLVAEDGVQLRRLSSDISTYAKAFPILLIGKPDSNLAGDQISKVKIKGIDFTGENTRHSTSGSAIMDGRQAIWIKNAKNVRIIDNNFDSIDSSAVYVQKPGEYDYENSAYYNTTKCYNIKIIRNDFIAESHATVGRALLHAVVADADNVQLLHNYFEWCDDALSCSTTYDDYNDLETDTYTNTNLATTVKRVGRGYTINGNTFYNSSEHALYLEAMSITATGNTFIVDNPTVCNTRQVQIRGRGVTCSSNTFTGVDVAAAINTGSMDVTFSGNTIQAFGDNEGGIINIQSQNLTAYIDARSDYFGSYKPMSNINVKGNTITMPDSAQTYGYAFRLYSDTSDTNYNTDGQMLNVDISGNIVTGCKTFVYHYANLCKRLKINDNTVTGKSFVEAGFTTGTAMNSLAVLAVNDALTLPLQECQFDNNTIYGFEYVLYDVGGVGANMRAPWGVRGNTMHYIKYWDTSAFLTPGVEQMFYNNQGNYFLDRTGWFGTYAINNSLSDGTSNSNKKTVLHLVSSSDVRIYHDDAGGYKAL